MAKPDSSKQTAQAEKDKTRGTPPPAGDKAQNSKQEAPRPQAASKTSAPTTSPKQSSAAAPSGDSRGGNAQSRASQPIESGRGGAGPLLWLILFLTLAIALGGGWYSYTMHQQQNNAYQAGRDLLLERINQLEREQDRLLASNREAQKNLADDIAQSLAKVSGQAQQTLGDLRNQVEQSLAGARSQLEQVPHTLGRQLLDQLITQAELLNLSRAQPELVRTLLEEALRIARAGEQRHYRELTQALETDLAELAQAAQAQSSQTLAQITAMRKRIRALAFAVVPKAEVQTSPRTEETPNTLAKVYRWVSNLFSQLVIVRRHEEAISVDLSIDQFNSIKLMIESALTQAQTSLLLGDAQAYTDALKQAGTQARKYLSRYDLEQFLATLDELIEQGLPQVGQLRSVKILTATE